jgi:hypothetical protein
MSNAGIGYTQEEKKNFYPIQLRKRIFSQAKRKIFKNHCVNDWNEKFQNALAMHSNTGKESNHAYYKYKSEKPAGR